MFASAAGIIPAGADVQVPVSLFDAFAAVADRETPPAVPVHRSATAATVGLVMSFSLR